MTEAQDKAGLPPRRSDAEIVAAVGTDPDQAPVRSEAEMERARLDEAARSTYTACCVCGGVSEIGQIEFANRYRLAFDTLAQLGAGPLGARPVGQGPARRDRGRPGRRDGLQPRTPAIRATSPPAPIQAA